MTTYYPVMLDLRDRLAVVIGAGPVAEQKLRELREAGARVRVVSPRASPAVEALAAAGDIEWIAREYARGDLRGARIAVAATGDAAVNARVWREAEARGVLLNAVDDVDRCHFIAPSVHREGGVTIAVSTGGACPALAVRLRERFARAVGPEHATLARIAGSLRAEVARRVPSLDVRRRLWYGIVDSTALASLRTGDEAAACADIETIIQKHETTTGTARASARPPGSVALVGAGPGDPELITVRGRQLLETADVVLHDQLVAPALVARAPAHARVVDVGKHGHGRAMPQRAINALLVCEARRGNRVVRLKGGDPFVFGRGGEELAHLRAAGIQCEVVPGVSSAIAAPLAAGIPVTQRGVASAFVVVAGHASNDGEPPDWTAIARVPTIIVLMALRSLGAIGKRLVAAGVRPDTPAAVVSRATLAGERIVTGTLSTIAAIAAAAQLEQPATLIVGEVVRLRRDDARPAD